MILLYCIMLATQWYKLSRYSVTGFRNEYDMERGVEQVLLVTDGPHKGAYGRGWGSVWFEYTISMNVDQTPERAYEKWLENKSRKWTWDSYFNSNSMRDHITVHRWQVKKIDRPKPSFEFSVSAAGEWQAMGFYEGFHGIKRINIDPLYLDSYERGYYCGQHERLDSPDSKIVKPEWLERGGWWAHMPPPMLEVLPRLKPYNPVNRDLRPTIQFHFAS
jgi:hypothetical protein